MYEPIHAELANLMRAVPEHMRSLNEATVNMCTQRVSGEINKDIKVMQVNLLKTLKENIKQEVCYHQYFQLFKCFYFSKNFNKLKLFLQMKNSR